MIEQKDQKDQSFSFQINKEFDPSKSELTSVLGKILKKDEKDGLGTFRKGSGDTWSFVGP